MTDKKLSLSNVRLSFPSLFEKSSFNNIGTGKYEATFLLDKETQKKQINTIKKAIADLILESKVSISNEMICLRDGDDPKYTEYAGYAGNMIFKTSSTGRPTVVNRDKTPMVKEDSENGAIYAGCNVNAIVGLWLQNNAYGKRINGNLFGVQFVSHNDAFGIMNPDVTDDFSDISDDETEDSFLE